MINDAGHTRRQPLQAIRQLEYSSAHGASVIPSEVRAEESIRAQGYAEKTDFQQSAVVPGTLAEVEKTLSRFIR